MEPAMTFEVMPLGRRGRFGMTPLQQRVYLAIVRLMDRDGVSPSYREIEEETGLWPCRVQAQVEELESRGWLTKRERCHRSITLTEPVMRFKPVHISEPASEVTA